MLVLLWSGKFSFSPLLFWFSFSILCFFSSCVVAPLTFLFLFQKKQGLVNLYKYKKACSNTSIFPSLVSFLKNTFILLSLLTHHFLLTLLAGWRHLNFCFASLHWPSYSDFELCSCTHIHDDCLILVLSTTPNIGMRCPLFKEHNHVIEKDFLFFSNIHISSVTARLASFPFLR